MTLPNKLTMLRILLIPVMIIIFYIPFFRDTYLIENSSLEAPRKMFSLALIISGSIFVIASLTDFLDGYLARKLNLVTTFGKFADPLADKILVMAALLLLADISLVPMWIIIVILAREFIVSGIRLLAVENKESKVIAASKLGKYKTATTMIAIIVLFLFGKEMQLEGIEIIGVILVYAALFLTVISGFDYFWKNRKIIFESI